MNELREKKDYYETSLETVMLEAGFGWNELDLFEQQPLQVRNQRRENLW